MYIIQSISSRIQAIQLLYGVINKISYQKKFIKKNIVPYLIDAKKNNDGSLEDNDLKKITGYYGLAVPAILGESFCALRGKKMMVKERLAATYQGAMTGLFDDFFDKQGLSHEAISDLMLKPDLFTGNTTSEKLFLQFYKKALASAMQPKLMQEQLYQVYHAQVLSKRQAGQDLSYEELKDITLRKGGESLLFYRTGFVNPYKRGEEKMLYCLGGLMQLSNDIFDVYKDQQQGIHTLVTTTKKIKDVRLLFSALLEISHEAAYKTSYAPENIKRFLSILSLGIFSRCFVCLDQLEKLSTGPGGESRSGNVFDPGRYQRKDLVCDMDTAGNKWKSLKYHLKTEH